jgi:Fur family ferric uptake transcriptional regulator
VHACPGNMSRLAPSGFTVENHDLTLYGRCKDCAAMVAT